MVVWAWLDVCACVRLLVVCLYVRVFVVSWCCLSGICVFDCVFCCVCVLVCMVVCLCVGLLARVCLCGGVIACLGVQLGGPVCVY